MPFDAGSGRNRASSKPGGSATRKPSRSKSAAASESMVMAGGRSLAVRHPDVLHLRGLAQELAAFAARGVEPVDARPWSTQVCFRLPAEAVSTIVDAVARAEVPDAHRRRRARPASWPARRASPVTMLTTPAGTSRSRAPGRGRSPTAGASRTAPAPRVLPIAIAGATSEIEAEQRRVVGADDADRRRSARPSPARRRGSAALCTAPSYLSAQAA